MIKDSSLVKDYNEEIRTLFALSSLTLDISITLQITLIENKDAIHLAPS